jgi:hypothetical protein
MCAAVLLPIITQSRSLSAVSLMSAPGSPGALEAIAGDTRAIVAVPEPAEGAAPTHYLVTAIPGGSSCSINAAEPLRVCTINSLTNGTSYTFTAVATNSAGTSPASPASNTITPSDMLAYETEISLTNSDNIASVMVMDPAGTFLLIGSRSTPGRITKVSLPDLTVDSVLTLNSGENDLLSGTIDPNGHFAYFGTISSGHIVKIDARSMTRVGSVSLEVGEIRARRLIFDAGRNVVYAAMYSDQGKVVKYSPDLTRLATVVLPAAARYPVSAVISPDGRYLYVGNTRISGAAHLARVDLNTFLDSDAVSQPMTNDDVHLATMILGPDEHLYVGTYTVPGRVLRVSTSALTREAALTLPAGRDYLEHVAVTADGRHAYFSTNNSPSSTLLKLDLAAVGSPGFEVASSITLPAAVTQVASMAMDPFGHRLYIGSNTTPARVVAVTVGPAPRQLPGSPPLVVATASATTALIAWQAPADDGGLSINGYTVEQATNSTGPWSLAQGDCSPGITRASTATSCTASGLSNQDYVFRVATRTTGGQGEWALTSAAVTPTGSPAVETTPNRSATPPPSPPPQTTISPAPSTPTTVLAPAPIGTTESQATLIGESLLINDGPLQLSIELVSCAENSCSVSILPSGRPFITMSQDGRVRVSGSGFQAGTLAQVWAFSNPILLGSLPIAEDGTFDGELGLVNLAPGEHTLQVHGLTSTGDPRSSELSLRVLAEAELPTTGGQPTPMLLGSLALMVLGIVGLRRVSSRRDHQVSPR